MRIHLLAPITGNDRIKWFHDVMFHGKCAVADLDYLTTPFHHKKRLGGALKLVCNGWKIPDFFMPRTRVVIASRIKEALAGIGTFAFRPVEFVKLIELPYQAGNFTFPSKQRGVFNPEQLFNVLPDVPSLHDGIGDYFELILPNIYELLREGQLDGPLTTLTVPFSAYSDSKNQLSSALMNTHLVLDAGYLIFVDAAFAALSPFIDWEYFETIQAEI